MTSTLEEALRPFVTAAVEALRRTPRDQMRVWSAPFVDTANSDKVVLPEAIVVRDYRWIAIHVTDRLKDDPRYAASIEACRAEIGERDLDPVAAVAAFLGLYFERADGRLDEAALAATAADLAAALHAQHFRIKMRGALTNYTGGDTPIVLADDVRIVRLDDSTRESLWRRHGDALLQMDRWAGLHGAAWTHALEVEYEAADESVPGIKQLRLLHAEQALAVHAPEATAVAATWWATEPGWMAWFSAAFSLFHLHGVMGAHHMGPLDGEPYAIAVGQEAAVRTTFERYVACEGEPRFDLAVRRYVTAAKEVRRVEDRILDYWIAFEALFLPDDAAELSYRVSLRIARVVGATAAERADLFAFLKNTSYAARSHVAHGRNPTEKFKVKGAPPMTLDEVAERTRAILSAALRAWIDPAISTDYGAIDAALLD